jgi:hypothetical protein
MTLSQGYVSDPIFYTLHGSLKDGFFQEPTQMILMKTRPTENQYLAILNKN